MPDAPTGAPSSCIRVVFRGSSRPPANVIDGTPTSISRFAEGGVEARSPGLGKGSEFVVRLPVSVGPAIEQPVPRVEVRERARPAMRRALIVDDLKDSADSLATLLREMGHEAHTAYDGEQAVVAAQNLKPDLILLDLGMPKLNGYEACRLIRLQPWAQATVLVAATGWGQEDDRLRSLEAGFHWHIVKPVDPGVLSQLLASLPTEETVVDGLTGADQASQSRGWD